MLLAFGIKRLKNELIENIMVKEVIALDVNTTYSKVALTMAEKALHHIPIISDNKLVGLVSRVDILRYSHSKVYSSETSTDFEELDPTVKMEQLMTDMSELVYLNSQQTLKDVLDVLTTRAFNSVPYY